ncbi:MAG: ribose-phosphate diphosphokinase, partial [Bacteroidota bacterium]
AKEIYGAVTHALLSGDAIKRIEDSAITKLYVTDSIPLKNGTSKKIVVRTSSGLLAEAIIRSHRNESISSLFDIDKN